MALVTQSGDPALWAILDDIYQINTDVVWVLHGGITYRVVKMTDGSTTFNPKTNRELYDSRSITGSKPASYNKLDGEV